MLLSQLALFLHIVAAFALIGGMLGGNIVAAKARGAADLADRRRAAALAAPFERMTTLAVPATILTGLVTLAMFGHSITELWVLATGAVNVALIAIQVSFWNKVGPQIQDALARGDDSAAVRLMRDPRTVAIGRLELGLAFVIVALMVFRPGWPG